jgi:hypothetical protein
MENLDVAAFTTLEQINEALKNEEYKFCFIDSINVITDVTPEGFKKLREKYPEVAFAITMQSNKDGNYKGKSDYSHGSDINIEVVKGTAKTIKSRFSKLSSYYIFEK